MVKFTTRIIKANPDQNSWSYIVITKRQVTQLDPPSGCSFRVKGTLDTFPIKFRSLLPMGDGRFILPINSEMRKGTGKKAGDTLTLNLELDKSQKRLSTEFLSCLKDDPAAYAFFKSLNKSNQHYFNGWIASAKTTETKAERIAMAVVALSKGRNYSEMRKSLKFDV